MKKKLLILFSAVAVAFVSASVTACSDDDDDDDKQAEVDSASSEFKSASADGEAFAEAYNAAKDAIAANGATDVTALTKVAAAISAGQKYKSSNDKTYKAGFISGATGATGLAEDQIEKILNNDKVSAAKQILEIINATK